MNERYATARKILLADLAIDEAIEAIYGKDAQLNTLAHKLKSLMADIKNRVYVTDIAESLRVE